MPEIIGVSSLRKMDQQHLFQEACRLQDELELAKELTDSYATSLRAKDREIQAKDREIQAKDLEIQAKVCENQAQADILKHHADDNEALASKLNKQQALYKDLRAENRQLSEEILSKSLANSKFVENTQAQFEQLKSCCNRQSSLLRETMADKAVLFDTVRKLRACNQAGQQSIATTFEAQTATIEQLVSKAEQTFGPARTKIEDLVSENQRDVTVPSSEAQDLSLGQAEGISQEGATSPSSEAVDKSVSFRHSTIGFGNDSLGGSAFPGQPKDDHMIVVPTERLWTSSHGGRVPYPTSFSNQLTHRVARGRDIPSGLFDQPLAQLTPAMISGEDSSALQTRDQTGEPGLQERAKSLKRGLSHLLTTASGGTSEGEELAQHTQLDISGIGTSTKRAKTRQLLLAPEGSKEDSSRSRTLFCPPELLTSPPSATSKNAPLGFSEVVSPTGMELGPSVAAKAVEDSTAASSYAATAFTRSTAPQLTTKPIDMTKMTGKELRNLAKQEREIAAEKKRQGE
ncbi:MAG: hypothetical protein Q9220_006300 [cf. Caloplaca sp. 1 TL-2023]